MASAPETNQKQNHQNDTTKKNLNTLRKLKSRKQPYNLVKMFQGK